MYVSFSQEKKIYTLKISIHASKYYIFLLLFSYIPFEIHIYPPELIKNDNKSSKLSPIKS